MLNPICIQRYHVGGQCYLVAGRNRLQAAEELGWETIDTIELPKLDGSLDAEQVGKLAEIAENLHRREITALERNKLLRQWMEIVEGREHQNKPAELRQVSEKGGRGKTGGLAQIARNLNVPRSTLQQAVKIAQLSPDAVAEMRKLKLGNNQDALLEAAKAKTPDAQVATLQRRAAAADKPKPSPKPKPTPEPKPNTEPRGLSALVSAWDRHMEAPWSKASKEAREAFAERIKETASAMAARLNDGCGGKRRVKE